MGTEEEIHIAGGSTDTLAALRAIRALTPGTIVVKRGPMGCVVFPDAIPGDLEQGHKGPGFPVDVFNILGAGDAFMAGFLRGWIRDEPLERCCAYANACGALVVSRHGCAPAMPSWIELQDFLSRGSPTRRLREDARLERLHRQTTRTRRWGDLAVLAFDHRAQFVEMAAPHGGDAARIAACKRLIAAGARQGANGSSGAGVIVDGRYGEDVLPTVTGTGLWVARPVELPGSRPLVFEAGSALAAELRTWPGEQVAKCLVYFHPDDPPELRRQQIERLRELQAACAATAHEFLVEVIPPADLPADATTIARALEAIYAADVVPDWWKLPPSPAAGGLGRRHRGDRPPRSALPRGAAAGARGERSRPRPRLPRRRGLPADQGLCRRPLHFRRRRDPLVRGPHVRCRGGCRGRAALRAPHRAVARGAGRRPGHQGGRLSRAAHRRGRASGGAITGFTGGAKTVIAQLRVDRRATRRHHERLRKGC